MTPIVNVASVKQLSPFRYPGGKTWLVPFINSRLERRGGVKTLVDPFLGGGSIPLGALHAGLAEKVVLSELDQDVAAVWHCVFGRDAKALAKRILDFKLTRESVVRELEQNGASTLDRAFRTILKNRTYRGGILAEGSSLMREGENGRGVASRWYPETLASRIETLSKLAPRVVFHNADGFEILEAHLEDPSCFIFIDPPYTVGKGAGSRLYRHSALDHRRLFELANGGSAEIVMTYDMSEEVLRLAKDFCFTIERVPMKSTHHVTKYELVISRNDHSHNDVSVGRWSDPIQATA